MRRRTATAGSPRPSASVATCCISTPAPYPVVPCGAAAFDAPLSSCRLSIPFLCLPCPSRPGVRILAVVVPFESHGKTSIDALVDLVAGDMDRVNAVILSRTGSEVTMIPEVAKHLINSGGKRLRPILTVAMANLVDYAGDGHVKLAAAVEFMHTATLLHDDVVDQSDMRRGKLAARMLWGNEASVLVGDFLLGQAFKMMVEV